jgi:hypothetical protein
MHRNSKIKFPVFRIAGNLNTGFDKASNKACLKVTSLSRTYFQNVKCRKD